MALILYLTTAVSNTIYVVSPVPMLSIFPVVIQALFVYRPSQKCCGSNRKLGLRTRGFDYNKNVEIL